MTMASTVVNQNNLADIIKSNQTTLKSIRSYLTDIISIVNSVKTLPAADIDKSFNVLRSVIMKLNDTTSLLSNSMPTAVLGEGYMKAIHSILGVVEELKKMKISVMDLLRMRWGLFLLRSVIKRLVRVSESIATISVRPIAMIRASWKLMLIKQVLVQVVDIVGYLQSIKGVGFIKSFIYMTRLRRSIRLISKVIRSLTRLDSPARLLPILGKLFVLHKILTYVQMVVDAVRHVRVGMFFFIKLLRVRRAVKNINKLTRAIRRLRGLNIGRMVKLAISLSFLSFILLRFAPIFMVITLLAVPAALAALAVPVVLLAIWGVGKMIKMIGRTLRARLARRAIRGLLWVGRVMQALVLIFAIIILTTPLAVIGAAAIWLIVLAVFSVTKAIAMMYRIIRRVAKPRVAKGLLALLVIITLVTIVMALILLMTIMAKPIAQGLGWTLLAFIGLLVIGAMIVGIGLLASTLTPVMGPVLVGLLFLVVLVSIVLILTTMMFLIQKMNLDRDKITYNVQTVIDTTFDIIRMLFESTMDLGGGKKSEGWFGKVISFFAGGLATIITAILSVFVLAVAVVAVLLILFLAAELRLLQEIELEPERIKTNVGVVMDAAVTVIRALFDSVVSIGGKKKSQGWFGKVISFFAGGFMTILTAILSVFVLAVSIVAVLLILFLATELRLLQTINLNPDKIKENVQTVISTALSVVTALFNAGADDSKESDKSWFVSVLEWIGGAVASLIGPIMAIMFLAQSITSIGLVILLATRLKTLQSIDLNRELIISNIDTTVGAALHVIGAIMSPAPKTNDSGIGSLGDLLLWVLPSGLQNLIGAIISIGFLAMSLIAIGIVTKLAENLQTITQISPLGDIDQKVNEIVNASKRVVDAVLNNELGLGAQIDAGAAKAKLVLFEDVTNTLAKMSNNLLSIREGKYDARIDWVNKLMQVIKSGSDLSAAQVNNYSRAVDKGMQFLSKVNSVNLEKLQTTARLFEAMANFSQSINGNFDGLAGTINVKIAPTLEEVKDLLERLESVVKSSSDVVDKAATSLASVEKSQSQQSSGNREIVDTINKFKKMFEDDKDKKVAAVNLRK